MGKHQKSVEKELRELREGAQIKEKRLRNRLKAHCSQSFKNLGIVDNDKNFETAERLLFSWFRYDIINELSQLAMQLFFEKYIKSFDLIKEQTELWKTLNKK